MSKTLLLAGLGSSCGKHEKPTLKGRTHKVPEESKRTFIGSFKDAGLE